MEEQKFSILGILLILFMSGCQDAKTSVPEASMESNCSAIGLPELACIGVSTNDEWEPFSREFDGVQMMLVPSGCFMMGNQEGEAEEQPAHEICFEQPYWIDLTEVTVTQYAQFMNEQGADAPPVWEFFPGSENVQIKLKNDKWIPVYGHDNRPIETVELQHAIELCAWRGARLPTEAEWEYAARGPDALLYPWGNGFNTDYVVRIQSETPNVGSKPQGSSWVGALDMSSSLNEWVSSSYQPYPFDADDGREASIDVDMTSDRVLRGGSWYHGDGMVDNLTATGRYNVPPGFTLWPFGFRCVASIEDAN